MQKISTMRLINSSARCTLSNKISYIGTWSVVSVCSEGTITAKARIYPLGGFYKKYAVQYINNFGERASGYATEGSNGIDIKLDFEERNFSDEAKLYAISDRLLRGTSPNCKIEATKD